VTNSIKEEELCVDMYW